MKSNSKEYSLFNDRYTVIIGDRGGVTVISNISYNNKPMKVYGKNKDGLRFVNLTEHKGGDVQSFAIHDIKDHVLDNGKLTALTETQVNEILSSCKPPTILSSEDTIKSLPSETNKWGQITYIEELPDHTRYYTKNEWKQASNGFLKYNYKVATHSNVDSFTTNNTTEVFTDKSKIVINDFSKVEDNELEAIMTLLSDELHKRESDKLFMKKIKYQIAMEDLIK